MNKWLLLALGGAGGTLARYVLASAVYARTGADFPYGTLAVNGVGCLIIGILAGWEQQRHLLSPEARLLLVIGFLGAFTTFSTLIYESGRLAQEGRLGLAGVNVLGSTALGFLAFWIGMALGNLLQ